PAHRAHAAHQPSARRPQPRRGHRPVARPRGGGADAAWRRPGHRPHRHLGRAARPRGHGDHRRPTDASSGRGADDPRRDSAAALTYIAVAGPGEASPEECEVAEAVGRELGSRGVVVVCGGLGGVMEAACRGAKEAGGMTVGILPGDDRSAANRFVDAAIPTGLGEGRNVLVVRAADAVIAVGGAYGTLSEIALALKAGKRVA